MTEQTKAVFSDPKLLREKLNEFLQTPNSVEIYAQAAEKFFEAGNKEKIELVALGIGVVFLSIYVCCYIVDIMELFYISSSIYSCRTYENWTYWHFV